MEANLIYRKTAAGEAAIRQRTRGEQRSTRTVLILVNGEASVADLCAGTGDQPMTENALHELVQGGLIEPIVGHEGRGEAGEMIVQETAESALGSPLPPSPSGAGKAGSNGDGKPSALRHRLMALFGAGRLRQGDGDFSVRPIARRGASLSWPARLIFAALGVATLAVLALSLFPYASYLPEVEAKLTQFSGQAAKVEKMHVSFYPKPGLFLSNVRFGRLNEQEEIRIPEIRLLPSFSALISARSVFRQAVLHGASLPAEALAGLPGLFAAEAPHVMLEQAEISFRGLAISGLSGEVRRAVDGGFESLLLHSSDRTLSFEAKPGATGMTFVLEADGWRPSPASPWRVDSGRMKGSLDGAALSLDEIELRIFDGLVQGAAQLRGDPQPGMAGEIVFERISAKRLGEALGIGAQFEGETAGKMKFSASAASWHSIFSALNAEGGFSMRRGVLGGIDLAEAARRGPAVPTSGGSTRFELLSGRFGVTPDSCRFSGLTLSSGLLQSVGQLSVARDLQLGGSMEIQMRGTVNQLRMPVSIRGPLNAPVLQAGRR
ncbi:MAG: hypothetical protein WAZ34_04840 [Rhodocyclaceae bacterium]